MRHTLRQYIDHSRSKHTGQISSMILITARLQMNYLLFTFLCFVLFCLSVNWHKLWSYFVFASNQPVRRCLLTSANSMMSMCVSMIIVFDKIKEREFKNKCSTFLLYSLRNEFSVHIDPEYQLLHLMFAFN